jgi:hypothetical protein
VSETLVLLGCQSGGKKKLRGTNSQSCTSEASQGGKVIRFERIADVVYNSRMKHILIWLPQ